MGRRSLADQLWEQYLEEEKGTATWLVIYDFQNTKPPTKLYARAFMVIKRGTMRTPGLVEARIQGILYFLRHRTANLKQ